MNIEKISSNKMHGGWQDVYQHAAKTVNCPMRFGIFLPPQAQQMEVPALIWLSGLTCTEQNFISKAGAQRVAAELGMAIIAPDTSPRGEDVPDDEAYDMGQGAGFYLNATQAPWSDHFQMYDYICTELPQVLLQNFPLNGQFSISGHSMGGHGALSIYLKNLENYKSCSAFSPIVAPSQVPWGQKVFTEYLGEDRSAWAGYDATELLNSGCAGETPILIDQGSADDFLKEQLRPDLFESACLAAGQPLELNIREGYDHSYYFIASFIESHVRFHYACLNK
jgi:S-formylglutathione hydrolase